MHFGLKTNSAQETRALEAMWGQLNAQRIAHFKMQVNAYNQNRDLYAQDAILASMTGQGLQLAVNQPVLSVNALSGAFGNFWAEIDNQIVSMREQESGAEILEDLRAVQTVLPIGKTAKMYNQVGDIADDVAVSIDGQAPYSFDHTDYEHDGDPVPVYTAGYGVNWRYREGLSTAGIDIVLDSQEAKLGKFNKKRIDGFMNGNDRISVAGMPQQGIRNHRNASMIDLGASGENIDLTGATPAQLIAFFTSGAFRQNMISNRVDMYDVLWVSPEIMGNLETVVTTNLSGTTLVGGTILDQIRGLLRVRDVRQTFALSGNEFFAYQRRRDVITPLVGMPTGVIAIPRQITQDNYNFQIMSAEGLQIKKDANGRSGVVYAGELT